MRDQILITLILASSLASGQTPQEVRNKLIASDVASTPLRPFDLSLQEFAAIAGFCRAVPGAGFSAEQREFLRNGYLLAPSAKAIEGINAAAPRNHRLGYRVSLAGEALIPVSVITCYRPGEPFDWAARFLAKCYFVYRPEDKFPKRPPPFLRPLGRN
jgi:hypothetical protein